MFVLLKERVRVGKEGRDLGEQDWESISRGRFDLRSDTWDTACPALRTLCRMNGHKER